MIVSRNLGHTSESDKRSFGSTWPKIMESISGGKGWRLSLFAVDITGNLGKCSGAFRNQEEWKRRIETLVETG